LETLFYLPNSDKNFTLASVLADHNSRIIEPDIIDKKGRETPASAAARFRCYDVYELCNFSLS